MVSHLNSSTVINIFFLHFCFPSQRFSISLILVSSHMKGCQGWFIICLGEDSIILQDKTLAGGGLICGEERRRVCRICANRLRVEWECYMQSSSMKSSEFSQPYQ